MCGSVVINCYWKHWPTFNEDPDCEDSENSLDVIRFEVQCKYPKVYSMTSLIRDKNISFFNVINEMLSDEVCNSIISKYYDRVIGNGNYYTLDLARKMIERKAFKPQKEQRLIDHLKLINESRGIANVKATLQGEELENFRRSLRELESMGINPVTIPKDWGIKYLPNFLSAYCDMQEEGCKEKLAIDYFKELRKKKSVSKYLGEVPLSNRPRVFYGTMK